MRRPLPGDHNPYFNKYVELTEDRGDIFILLHDLRLEMQNIIHNISDLNYAYAPGKWTLAQSLIHLIDTEKIFTYRALAIARGADEVLPGYNHNIYADHDYSGLSQEVISDYFDTTRKSTLSLFRTIGEDQIEKRGIVSDHVLTVSSIPYILAGHQMHHQVIFQEKYKLTL